MLTSGGQGSFVDTLPGSGGTPGRTDAGLGAPPIEDFRGNDCPGALPAGDAMALEGAPTANAAMRFLYPYDGTVWPRGLLSPVLQWTPPPNASDAVRVHIYGKHVDYVACLRTTGPAQLELLQDVWERISEANEGAGDPLTVELTALAGGVGVGPIVQKWTFANAKMKGAVFYNSYNSPLAGLRGAVLRLHPGAPAPEVFLSRANFDECTGCHAVAANGERIAAETHGFGGISYVTSTVFPLTPTSTPNPAPIATDTPPVGFAGFYPDGSRFLTTASPGTGGPFVPGNLPGKWGPQATELVSDTGQAIANSGIVATAKMPSFSADGRHVIFTDHTIGGNGKGLAMMDFDAATNQFSNYRQVYSHSTLYPGWAFLFPDNSGIIFALGTSDNYVTALGLPPQDSDLYFVDLRNGNVATPLARANGFLDAAQTQPYVPAGARDLHKNFFPTVVPVAAGGYFWIFFTSRRTYGNIKTGLLEATDSKQLWVSAVGIGGSGDVSYPAFYLRGQELAAGNIRAFAALEPCRDDGSACETGIDCCSRFCTDGVCGPPVQECSEIDQGCDTVSDCCDQSGQVDCIAGFCAVKIIIQ